MNESPWPRTAATLAAAAAMLVMLWWETPEWQREAAKRLARHHLRRAAARLARASGRRAMGDELAGRVHEAEAGYRFTFRLSSARDRL